MAAATEAARSGLFPTLIDEAPHLGGQVYRQIPEEFRVRHLDALGKDFVRGDRLRAEFEGVADRIELRSRTSVLGVWGGRELLAVSDKDSRMIRAEQLILATGAYERPVPFPGWTLPGVMAAGGVQSLIKTMHIRPGRRALIAGTGALILSLAHRLHEIGVKVVAVLEAGSPPWADEAFWEQWDEWDFINEMRDNCRGLNRASIPILLNQTIFAAHGCDAVERVTYGPVDPLNWRPLRELARTVEVDLVCVGYGFVPNTELAVLAGCRHHYVHELGGWTPLRDRMMRTTVANVFAVGDGAGIRGAPSAMEQGRIAGITAAEKAGSISRSEAESRRAAPLDRLNSMTRVLAVLDEISRFRSGLLDLVTPETLVCRCEEVSVAEIDSALDQGARDLQAIKLLSRLGMGPCQGRNCEPSVALYVTCATGRTPQQVGRINPRPPVKPVTLGALTQIDVADMAVSDPRDALDHGRIS